MKDLSELLDMDEAGERLNLSRDSVYRLILKKKLFPEKHFNRNFFSLSEIERFEATRKEKKSNECACQP